MSSIMCNACSGTTVLCEENKERVIFCSCCHKFIDLNDFNSYTFNSIGEFQIIAPIGLGSMGFVYRAKQINLCREVAIKILPPGNPSQQEELTQRFLKEMQLAAKFEHPNIVSIHQAGETHGFLYYSMSLIKGQSLDEIIQTQGPLEELEALNICLKVAEALNFIWKEFKVMHRDIKPANIMLSQQGEIKLLDMGLAKSLTDNNNETKTGAILGSPSFLSPEQTKPGNLDFRSDMFSLGSTLYFLLSQHAPFLGQNIDQTIYNVANASAKPLADYNPNISAETTILIEMMMDKNPDNRFEQWSDLIESFKFLLLDYDNFRKQKEEEYDETSVSQDKSNIILEESATDSPVHTPSPAPADEATIMLRSSLIPSRIHAGINKIPFINGMVDYTHLKVHNLLSVTSIMDWVSYDCSPELKNLIGTYRDTLIELDDYVGDLYLYMQLANGNYAFECDSTPFKTLIHSIKAEVKKLISGTDIDIIIEKDEKFTGRLETDRDLFLKMILSAIRYFTSGMTKGEIIISSVVAKDGFYIDLHRKYLDELPTTNPKKHMADLDKIEGLYMCLAWTLADILGGKILLPEDSNDHIQFNFCS